MHRVLCYFAILCLWIFGTDHLLAGDWPHCRGPNRNDIVGESSGWQDGRWELGEAAWTGNVGLGSTSPIIAGGKLYSMGWHENKETVVCLDAKTGAEIWKRSYDSPKYGRFSVGDKGIYSGPSSTPEFDKKTGYLYTLGIDGDLHCWNTKQEGSQIWGVNLYDRYTIKRRPNVGKRKQRDYGYTSSVLVWGEWVIVEVGASEGTLIAFDKRTGKQRWASEVTDEAGHTGSPVPMMVDNVPCVCVLSLRHLLVVRLDQGNEGKTVATYPWLTDFANNIPTPTVHEDSVLLTTAYNRFAICRVRVTLSGATKVWEQPYASGVCSPVVHRGHVYWAWRGIHCLDFETGKRRWTGGKVGTAGSCLATSDDKLIVWANRGDLLLVETADRSPSKYTELASRMKLFSTDAWPHLVLAASRLYCKDRAGNMMCFPVGEKSR